MTKRADQLHHNNAPAHSTALMQAFFGKASHHTSVTVEREEICECDGHRVRKLSHWHLTADWLAPRESDYSWMHNKVSFDLLPSYTKAMQPVLEIFRMALYFLESPCISIFQNVVKSYDVALTTFIQIC